MAVSAGFLTFILEQLGEVRALSSRRMFGGIGLYCDDLFFGVIDNDTLFFKVDADLAARYRQLGMPPFQPMPDRPAMLGYYQVPPGVLEDADTLASWARESIVVARTTPPKASKRRR